jgi:8-oxo-dGTP pyrophosphatase MutT (NUDIX family)
MPESSGVLAGLPSRGRAACQHEAMSEPLLQRTGVELLDVRRLRLVEVVAPEVPPDERLAMDRVWDAAARTNPHLFDGPVVACPGLERDATGDLVLSWARTTYRRYALRRVPGATSVLPSLGAGVVQPTDDGRLLAGRMASWTSVPDRWQLPGGAVEPPDDDETFDLAALRRQAARELAEETGVDALPGDLSLWRIVRGVTGNVVVLFLAPSRPAALLHEQYAAFASAEAAAGRVPELDRITFVGSPAESAALDGPQVRFLEPVVRQYTTES